MPRRSPLALRLGIIALAIIGTYQTATGHILPALQVSGAAQWLVYLCLGILGLALVPFLLLTAKRRFWSALFVVATLNSLAVALVLFAYPTPDLSMLGVLWLGPVLYGAAAYFWEWSKDVSA